MLFLVNKKLLLTCWRISVPLSAVSNSTPVLHSEEGTTIFRDVSKRLQFETLLYSVKLESRTSQLWETKIATKFSTVALFVILEIQKRRIKNVYVRLWLVTVCLWSVSVLPHSKIQFFFTACNIQKAESKISVHNRQFAGPGRCSA
jgi:hypothetical protein